MHNLVYSLNMLLSSDLLVTVIFLEVLTHQYGEKGFSIGISKVEYHSFGNFDTVLLLDELAENIPYY